MEDIDISITSVASIMDRAANNFIFVCLCLVWKQLCGFVGRINTTEHMVSFLDVL